MGLGSGGRCCAYTWAAPATRDCSLHAVLLQLVVFFHLPGVIHASILYVDVFLSPYTSNQLQHTAHTAPAPLLLLQPPDALVNEGTLRQLAALRPSNLQEMGGVSGMSAAALTHFGPRLLAVVVAAVAASHCLRHNSGGWHSAKAPGSSGRRSLVRHHW